MNRRQVLNSAVIAAAAAATTGIASAADKEIELFIDHWKKSKDFSLKVANAMPPANYDYKPFPDARSFGAELAIGRAHPHRLPDCSRNHLWGHGLTPWLRAHAIGTPIDLAASDTAARHQD